MHQQCPFPACNFAIPHHRLQLSRNPFPITNLYRKLSHTYVYTSSSPPTSQTPSKIPCLEEARVAGTAEMQLAAGNQVLLRPAEGQARYDWKLGTISKVEFSPEGVVYEVEYVKVTELLAADSSAWRQISRMRIPLQRCVCVRSERCTSLLQAFPMILLVCTSRRKLPTQRSLPIFARRRPTNSGGHRWTTPTSQCGRCRLLACCNPLKPGAARPYGRGMRQRRRTCRVSYAAPPRRSSPSSFAKVGLTM